jgi:hypothetical protein
MSSLTQTGEDKHPYQSGIAIGARGIHFQPDIRSHDMVAQGRSEEGTGEAQCSWSPWFSMQFGPNYGVLRQEMAEGQALIGAAPPLASPLSLPFDNNSLHRFLVNIPREGAGSVTSSSDSDLFNDWGDQGLIGGDDLTSPSCPESGEDNMMRERNPF